MGSERLEVLWIERPPLPPSLTPIVDLFKMGVKGFCFHPSLPSHSYVHVLPQVLIWVLMSHFQPVNQVEKEK